MNNLASVLKKDGWELNQKTGERKPTKLHSGEWLAVLKKFYASRLRFNLVTLLPEIDGQPVRGDQLELLYIDLNEKGWSIEPKPAKDAFLRAAKSNSYNPIKEYLELIEKDNSICPANIDLLSSTYLGTNDTLYNSMLAATLIGAVSRALTPGSQMDYICTLKGDQGIKKSSFWRILAGEYFCDTPQKDQKDLRLAIATTWIYEFQELEVMTTKRLAGEIKALLTIRADTFRPPYGTLTESHPRGSIFVATVNSDDFLRDETGSRRFWIIECPQLNGEQIDIAKLEEERDSIWKAALIAYRSGRKPMLTHEEENKSHLRNTRYETENPLSIPIQNELARWPSREEFTTQEILIEIFPARLEPFKPKEFRDTAIVLKQLGYKQDKNQTRKDGKRLRLWRRIDE